MTRPDLAAIRAIHQSKVSPTDVLYCSYCFKPWPCDAIRLADALEEVERERDRLRKVEMVAKKLRDLEPWVVTPVGSKGREITWRFKELRDALAAPLDGAR